MRHISCNESGGKEGDVFDTAADFAGLELMLPGMVVA